MAPQPKRRQSTHRTGKRRKHHRVLIPTHEKCTKCGQYKLPHYMCQACGHHPSNELVVTTAPKSKTEKPPAKTETKTSEASKKSSTSKTKAVSKPKTESKPSDKKTKSKAKPAKDSKPAKKTTKTKSTTK